MDMTNRLASCSVTRRLSFSKKSKRTDEDVSTFESPQEEDATQTSVQDLNVGLIESPQEEVSTMESPQEEDATQIELPQEEDATRATVQDLTMAQIAHAAAELAAHLA